jgi:hypothetical protein
MVGLSEEDLLSVSPEAVVSIYLDFENLNNRGDDLRGEIYLPSLPYIPLAILMAFLPVSFS